MSSQPSQPVKVGIIGCGNISGIYFKAGKTFPILEIAACAADAQMPKTVGPHDDCPDAFTPKARSFATVAAMAGEA